MNNKRKAPTGVVTPTRADGGVQPDDNTCNRQCQRVSDLLRHGGENPTSCRELTALTGWRPREITRAIEAERRSGVAIAANSRGYFLPADTYELDRYLTSLLHRENEVKKTRLAVAQTRQTTLFS